MKRDGPVTLLGSLLVMILSFLFITSTASAEVKTFEKEYTYRASEDDSRNSSRAIALREVKRLLLEELGTYLESETEVKNFRLTKDQITMLTAGIVKTAIIEEKWDGRTYWLKSEIAVDSDELVKAIDALRQDREKRKELEELRNRSNELFRENKRLLQELQAAKGETRQERKAAYDESIKDLSAIDWFEKAYAFHESGHYREAIDAYSKAIELNPNIADAYNNRGFAYRRLGNNQQAVEDYTRAIALNPRHKKAYTNRGAAYGRLGSYPQAIKDFDRAIELNPRDVAAYHNRGMTYGHLGNNQQAIKDYTRAIELDPNFAWAYYHRGFAYKTLGENQQAIVDLKNAARLGLKEAQVFLRGQGIAW